MDKTNFRKYEDVERVNGAWESVTVLDENDKTVSYGDIKPDSAGHYIEVPYTTYSDYRSGTDAVSCYWDIEDIVKAWPSPLPHFYTCKVCKLTFDTLREHCDCQLKML